MKAYLIFIFAFVKLSFQEEFAKILDSYESNIKPVEDMCIAETNAEPELARTLLIKGDFPNNRALKCYAKCVFEKTDIINKNGEIVDEILRQHIGVSDEAMAEKIFEKCKVIRGGDLCETAYEIGKCVYQGAQEVAKNV